MSAVEGLGMTFCWMLKAFRRAYFDSTAALTDFFAAYFASSGFVRMWLPSFRTSNSPVATISGLMV